MIYLKKGAMFGLDARIALVIFGALSVISGAALYSAIQQARVVQASTTLNELSKAIEAYYIDTATPIPEYMPSSNVLNIGNLYNNFANVKGWNGPYFGSNSSNQAYLEFSLYGMNKAYYTRRYTKSDWGSTLTTVNPKACTDTDCYIYLIYNTNHATDAGQNLNNYFNNLDKEIDNSDGPGLGKVRAMILGVDFHIYYQVFPEYNRM
ncbi:MAG: hypothetical protein CFH44_00450 [Proteobacteria bacterium]|nr:MAG: hypothetical protein CFH44_00450 [Pseudomonadota bacterium]|tara:strand:- start:998 stop:1618 length:621 start_codon:yes stop_codon:yes gene_type:complete